MLFKGGLGGYLSRKADTEESKAFWADGGNGLVLLHGMAGTAMAALGGADALKGAVSAAGAEKAKIAISEFLENNRGSLSGQDYKSLWKSAARWWVGAGWKHGRKHCSDRGPVQSAAAPDGNTAIARTGWIYDPGSATPGMTTLYVK